MVLLVPAEYWFDSLSFHPSHMLWNILLCVTNAWLYMHALDRFTFRVQAHDEKGNDNNKAWC